jgi:Uma2 family endonuclease
MALRSDKESVMATETGATVEDLYKIKDKAELVDGQLKIMEPTGGMPNRASFTISASLHEYERRTRSGFAYSDSAGFLVDLPHRQSFSPDASYFVGDPPSMRFMKGAPVFAVEVRSEGDYGPAAEREMAAKRADYFAAGTQVVWDVDLVGANVVRVFRDGNATTPAATYRRGETAEAEPAVPGWQLDVDALFE